MRGEERRGEARLLGWVRRCSVHWEVGVAVGWGSHGVPGAVRALPPALTFAFSLCRAPGICQAPECELPGCGWVSAPWIGCWVLLLQHGWACSTQYPVGSAALGIIKLSRVAAEPQRMQQHPERVPCPKTRASPAEADPTPAWILAEGCAQSILQNPS